MRSGLLPEQTHFKFENHSGNIRLPVIRFEPEVRAVHAARCGELQVRMTGVFRRAQKRTT
jgi:hypothetical protein